MERLKMIARGPRIILVKFKDLRWFGNGQVYMDVNILF